MTRLPGLRAAGLWLAVALVWGCGSADAPDAPGAPARADAETAEVAPRPGADRTEADLPVDWQVLDETLTWAYQERLDTLHMGQVMVAVGRRFVGTPYEPHTLEVPGPEQLIINFEALDCVTYVENVLALSRFVRTAPPAVLGESHVYQSLYRGILRRIRYRDGELSGYPSRLHYFSEWIADAEAKDIAVDQGPELGGVPDAEPVNFMSTHPDAYRQLSETEALDQVRRIEERLSAHPRIYVPQDRIAEVAPGIRDGDIIAATSTVDGLDVAHTGIALWIDGELHLMHAPLVGEAVQISERTLARRIQDISGQDGIMVARPVEPGGR